MTDTQTLKTEASAKYEAQGKYEVSMTTLLAKATSVLLILSSLPAT